MNPEQPPQAPILDEELDKIIFDATTGRWKHLGETTKCSYIDTPMPNEMKDKKLYDL